MADTLEQIRQRRIQLEQQANSMNPTSQQILRQNNVSAIQNLQNRKNIETKRNEILNQVEQLKNTERDLQSQNQINPQNEIANRLEQRRSDRITGETKQEKRIAEVRINLLNQVKKLSPEQQQALIESGQLDKLEKSAKRLVTAKTIPKINISQIEESMQMSLSPQSRREIESTFVGKQQSLTPEAISSALNKGQSQAYTNTIQINTNTPEVKKIENQLRAQGYLKDDAQRLALQSVAEQQSINVPKPGLATNILSKRERFLETVGNKIDNQQLKTQFVLRPSVLRPVSFEFSDPLIQERIADRYLLKPIPANIPIVQPMTSISQYSIDNTRYSGFKKLPEAKISSGKAFTSIVDTGSYFVPVLGQTQAVVGVASFGQRALKNPQGVKQFIAERPLETGVTGLLVLGGGSSLAKGTSRYLYEPTKIVYRAGTQGEALAGIGVVETKGSELLKKVRLQRLSGKLEKPFVFAEEKIGQKAEITASRGMTVFKEQQIGTKSLSKQIKEEIGNFPSEEVSITKTSDDIYIGSRSRSRRISEDKIISAGIVAQEGKKVVIPFVGLTKDVPKVTEVLGDTFRVIEKNDIGKTTQRIDNILEKIATDVKEIKTPRIKNEVAVLGTTKIETKSQSINLGSQIQIEKQKEDYATKVLNKAKQNEATKTRARAIDLFSELENTRTRSNERTGTIVGSIPITRDLLGEKTFEITRTDQLQRARQISRTTPRTLSRTLNIPKLKPFALNTSISSQDKILKKSSRNYSNAYRLLVKRYGKYRPVGEFTRGRALQTGEQITRSNLGRSFKIERTNRLISEKDIPYKVSDVFRTYKVRQGRRVPLLDEFIQKSRYSLSSRGEVREIQSSRKRKQGRRFRLL